MKTWTAEEIVAKFQYSFACTEESFDVDGFTVEIVRDECADNPHDRGDCESPAIWLHHGLHEYGDENLGDVYGYRIKDETGDEVDSCYGFYVFGELDPIKSGIAEAICESLNWEIKKSTEAKADAFVMEMELARPDLAPAYL